MESQMGQPLEAVFSAISAEPIAAASLGQVYRARLRATGAEVTVKVTEGEKKGERWEMGSDSERECGKFHWQTNLVALLRILSLLPAWQLCTGRDCGPQELRRWRRYKGVRGRERGREGER